MSVISCTLGMEFSAHDRATRRKSSRYSVRGGGKNRVFTELAKKYSSKFLLITICYITFVLLYVQTIFLQQFLTIYRASERIRIYNIRYHCQPSNGGGVGIGKRCANVKRKLGEKDINQTIF